MGLFFFCASKMCCITADQAIDGEISASGHYHPKHMNGKRKNFESVDDSIRVGIRNHHTQRKLHVLKAFDTYNHKRKNKNVIAVEEDDDDNTNEITVEAL